MSQTPTTVSVMILDKEYQVACPEEDVDALTASARFLDQQMMQIKDSGKVFGLDRIAVMAALNIAHEYLNNRSSVDATQDMVGSKVGTLVERLDRALAEQKQLNL
jgi:cell division protein ZapA